MFQIRSLNISDTRNYTEMVKEANTHLQHVYTWSLYGPLIADNSQIRYILSENSPFKTFGVFKDDQLIGIASIRMFQLHTMNHKCCLENMYVIDANTTAATQLIQAIKDFTKEAAIEIIMTASISNAISAQVFFSDHGFESMGFERRAKKVDETYIDERWFIHYNTAI